MNSDYDERLKKAKSISKYDLCWCGSGKKYKWCHFERHLQVAIPLDVAAAQIQKAFERETCLHPLAGPGACEGQIVHAHSIQKRGALAVIADSNKEVLTFSFKNIFQTKKEMPRTVSWKTASAFTGFCRKHDSALFEPLEGRPYTGTQEQVFLAAYRALCHEHYLKVCALDSNKRDRETLDRGKTLEFQVELQLLLEGMGLGFELGLKDLSRWKELFVGKFIEGDFEFMASLEIRFRGTFVVATTGASNADMDLAGIKIQDYGDLGITTEHFCFSLEPMDDGVTVVFAWPKGSKSIEGFIQSVLSVESRALGNVLIQFFFRYSENIFFSHDWWGGLDLRQKTLIENNAVAYGPEVFEPYDLDANLVDWEIVEIIQR